MTGLSPEGGGLADAIERILDKGLIINADICVSVAGTELLGIKIRAALASFETAALYGLDFPSGTNLNAPGWREIERKKVNYPEYAQVTKASLPGEEELILRIENQHPKKGSHGQIWHDTK
ncbi:MAG: gas vesicle protein [Nitrospirae bacterium]|nr:gas vesicle protein [Nitrospirota bacterium]